MRQAMSLAVSVLVALALGAGSAQAAGTITTVAGPGTFGTPGDGGPATGAYIGSDVGVTALPDGGYLIAHQGAPALRRVLPDGTITTLAGNGTAGYSGDGGPATSAQLDAVSIGVPAPDGGYLLADPNNNVVRRVAPDGTISTVAGIQSLGAGFGGDNGPATSARLSFPVDLAFMPDGSYLIADKDNDRIRRVDTSGTITTVAGGGGALGDGGPATSAQLTEPSGVTPTPDGGYLIGDGDGNRVRKVAADGTITTVAGTGVTGSTGDGGPATAAQLHRPTHIALQADGGFLIAEDMGARVRRVAPDNTISTIAGNGTAGFGGDSGPATDAQLNRPLGVAVLPSSDILIADASNGRVRFLDQDTPAPTLSGTTPVSPGADTNPRILGSAPPGTTVSLFTDGTCSGSSVAGGLAADLAGAGIPVAVPLGSSTTFNAVDVDAGGFRSACSSTSVSYKQQTPLPPPKIGVSVNAVPAKGTVLVKVPGRGFVPLATLGRQLPVGSILDTTKGTVRLTSAKNKKGATQFGLFSKGVFKFTQSKKNPLTTLSMTGGGLSSCSRLPSGGSPKQATEARKRRRTLFSNVKGSFRTRGRNSAATVRGTEWTMTDTCAGTLTIVKKGTVVVRDFRLRKNRTVKTGRRYFAKAPPLRVQRRGNR